MDYPLLFSAFNVGPMRVKNRVVLPPHAHVMASLWGREIEAGEHLAGASAPTWLGGRGFIAHP